MYKGIPIVLGKDPAATDIRDAIPETANEIWKPDENKVKEYYGTRSKRLIGLRH